MITKFSFDNPRYIEIEENEYLTDVFKREKFPHNAIPTNCIFDKTLPGLGATYSEIKAKRNSIIIEPNVPVIKGKTQDNNKLLGVFEGVSESKIKTYLLNEQIEYKKIVCTPESYMRVRKTANKNNINLYDKYFCLFDECEKIAQDIDYRELISLPIEDFFLYKNKAFVSATPLQTEHPKFTEQLFQFIKIKPKYDYRKKIDLITTNNFEHSVKELFEKLKESPCVCVFINSTTEISKWVQYLRKKNITDYKVFCSPKSVYKTKGKDNPITEIYADLNYPLARYNFFTSRFFSAVDILSPAKPDIVILTNLNEAEHTKIDPFTNAIQIYGRFRNAYENDGKRFNSLTHVSNYGISGVVIEEEYIPTYIIRSKHRYEKLKKIFVEETPENPGNFWSLSDELIRMVYYEFLDKDGILNYFKIDNFYDEHRVKGYYKAPDKLLEAYESTNHFVVNYTNYLAILPDSKIKNYLGTNDSVERRKLLVEQLELIHTNNFSDEEKNKAEARFYKEESMVNKDGDRKAIAIQKSISKRNEETEYTIKAYHILGKQQMEQCGYQKGCIDKLLKQHQAELDEKKMFSKTVRDEIFFRFGENKDYHINELTDGFKEIFTKNGITTNILHGGKIAVPILKKFYELKQRKSQGKYTGIIQLYHFQPDKEYD